jgi:hypothetical protein
MRTHVFAPFFLLAIALFWLAGLLPEKYRGELLQWVLRIERRTALPTMLLIALVLYWAGRLLYVPALSRLAAG